MAGDFEYLPLKLT